MDRSELSIPEESPTGGEAPRPATRGAAEQAGRAGRRRARSPCPMGWPALLGALAALAMAFPAPAQDGEPQPPPVAAQTPDGGRILRGVVELWLEQRDPLPLEVPARPGEEGFVEPLDWCVPVLVQREDGGPWARECW